MELTNYHAHTWRCKHADGTEESYVQTAIEAGFKVLGFSDHTPWPYSWPYISRMRMEMDKLEGYIKTVRDMQAKYADKIEIRLGLECEAFPEFMGWLADTKAQYLDYVIMGNHFAPTDDQGGFYFGGCKTVDEMKNYINHVIGGMRTGLYNYVAHPDLFCRAYPTFDADCCALSRELCAASKELNVPLEYNLLGLRYHDNDVANGGLGYPCQNFWEVAAEMGCTAIIGVDAHKTEHMADLALYQKAEATLNALGIAPIKRII